MNNTKTVEEEIESRAKWTAVGHFLADYPENATPDEIREMLLADDERVLLWHPFENYEPAQVDEWIENLYLCVKRDLLGIASIAQEKS